MDDLVRTPAPGVKRRKPTWTEQDTTDLRQKRVPAEIRGLPVDEFAAGLCRLVNDRVDFCQVSCRPLSCEKVTKGTRGNGRLGCVLKRF